MNPQAHIEIIQQLYGAFGRRDMPAILEMLSPEVEWGEPSNPYNPAGGMRRGHEGFLEWANVGRQAEDILVLEPRKMLVDEDSVAVVGYLWNAAPSLPARPMSPISSTLSPSIKAAR